MTDTTGLMMTAKSLAEAKARRAAYEKINADMLRFAGCSKREADKWRNRWMGAADKTAEDVPQLLHDHELLLGQLKAFKELAAQALEYAAMVTRALPESALTDAMRDKYAAVTLALRACGLGDAGVTAPAEGEG